MNDDLDPKLLHLYRQLPKEQPSQAVDVAILQAAQQAIATKTYWRPVWGLAASVVMMSSLVWYWQAQQPQELSRAVAVSASPTAPIIEESVAKPVEQDEQDANLLTTDKLSAAPPVAEKPAKKTESLAKAKMQASTEQQALNELKEEFALSAPAAVVEQKNDVEADLLSDVKQEEPVAAKLMASPRVEERAALKAELSQERLGAQAKENINIYKHRVEQVKQVFATNFSQLNVVYQQAVKENANHEQGVVRFKLIVDKNGIVTFCKVASSNLNNPELEAKLVEIVKKFNFGEATEEWRGTYPVYFVYNVQ